MKIHYRKFEPEDFKKCKQISSYCGWKPLSQTTRFKSEVTCKRCRTILATEQATPLRESTAANLLTVIITQKDGTTKAFKPDSISVVDGHVHINIRGF